MNITINKKTELAAIFFNISNYKKLYPELNKEFDYIRDYKNNIYTWFNSFKNHESIKLFNEIVEKLSFAYDAPLELFLHLNDDYTYDEDIIFNKNTLVSEFITSKEEKSLFLSFLNTLPDFVRDSNFEAYYRQNIEFYNRCIEIGRKPITKFKVIERLSEFIKNNDFYKNVKINLLPFTNGNHGLTINGIPYPNYGLDDNPNELIFNTQYPSIIVHELLHSKINSLTEKNIETVKKFNFSEVEELLRDCAHIKGNSAIVNEYIVRAIETIITNEIYLDEERYQRKIKHEKGWGFVHIEWIIDRIKIKNENEKIDYYYGEILNDFLEYTKNLTSKEEKTDAPLSI